MMAMEMERTGVEKEKLVFPNIYILKRSNLNT